ncbi:nucleotidyltransferase domain-containing protein [Candidatus Parcubacteria bacterium]|nr:nucleotidyltransferase domain-containing protein [Candidatus Parcubacteria bacterium]MCG2700946.1 nucleotidyltransferase domain-containing protein [Candidatus Parcubacteria bacterium]
MAEKILSNKQINIAVKKIAQQAKDDNMPIAKAFMFGSYAQNKAKKYSDLDLCFVSPSFKDTFKAEVYLRTKFHSKDIGLNVPVDIIAYNLEDFKDITIPLVYEIKKYGREIKLN